MVGLVSSPVFADVAICCVAVVVACCVVVTAFCLTYRFVNIGFSSYSAWTVMVPLPKRVT